MCLCWSRPYLTEDFNSLRVPLRIVQAVNAIYCNTQAKVEGPDGGTEQFMLLVGVLQGNKIAPYLFIIVLDYAL